MNLLPKVKTVTRTQSLSCGNNSSVNGKSDWWLMNRTAVIIWSAMAFVAFTSHANSSNMNDWVDLLASSFRLTVGGAVVRSLYIRRGNTDISQVYTWSGVKMFFFSVVAATTNNRIFLSMQREMRLLNNRDGSIVRIVPKRFHRSANGVKMFLHSVLLLLLLLRPNSLNMHWQCCTDNLFYVRCHGSEMMSDWVRCEWMEKSKRFTEVRIEIVVVATAVPATRKRIRCVVAYSRWIICYSLHSFWEPFFTSFFLAAFKRWQERKTLNSNCRREQQMPGVTQIGFCVAKRNERNNISNVCVCA